MSNTLATEDQDFRKFVPKIDKLRDNGTFKMLQFFKFGAVWTWSGKKVVEDDIEYLNIALDIEGHWGIAHEMSGRIQLDYGGDMHIKEFDINKKREIEFENVCEWSEFERRIKNDTQLEVSIWIDKEYGIDMRRTRKYEKDGLTDGLIVTKTHKFHVSKAMMSLHSPFFLHQFQKSSEIELDIDGETVEAMLDMIHPPFVLPKNWVEHGFEWQEFYTKETKEEDDEESDEEDGYIVDGKLNAARIRSIYGAISHGYKSDYFLDVFLDEDHVKEEEKKAENDKFGATSKYRILEAAKKLKLSGVRQMTKKKFIEEMDIYENYENYGGRMSAQWMNETIAKIKSDRWNSFKSVYKNTDLPIRVDKMKTEVSGVGDTNMSFIGRWWYFNIKEINEENEEVIRKGEGLTKDQWIEMKEKLAEDHKFIILDLLPYNLDDVKGTITVRIKGSKIVDLRRILCRATKNKHFYIGKLTKKMLEEEDTTMTITISVDEVDRRDAQRKYVDYNVYHPDISTGKVTVGDQVFHVTKELLSYHSPLFHQLFQSSSEIELTDINRHDFRRILNMIYPTQLLPNSWDGRMEKKELLGSITRMLEFAHRYGIDIVKEMIVKYLEDCCMQKMMEWELITADKFAMPNLLINCQYWGSPNLADFVLTPEFETLSRKLQRILWDSTSWREKFNNAIAYEDERLTELYGDSVEKRRKLCEFKLRLMNGTL